MKSYKYTFIILFLSSIYVTVYAQSHKEVTVPIPGELKTILGDDWNKIDSIVVKGTINKTDFKTLYDCSRLGKLTVINLEYANVEGNKIPDWALLYPKIMNDYLNIQRIILPDNIEEIGEYAFANMYLKKINLPTSLKKFSKGSFCGCHWMSVDPLIIPEGITEIPMECFAHCQNFRKLVLPQSLKILDGFSFYNTRIDEMNLPEGLDSIGIAAFWASCLLRKVVIPEGATHLGLGAFGQTDSLRNLTLPHNITEIPNLFLAYSNEIDSIIIPDEVTRIGSCAFQWDYDLGYIQLPSKLKSIGYFAFEATNMIETVLPETLELIEKSAFFRLNLLERVYCMAKIPPIAQLDPGNQNYGPFNSSVYNCVLYVPVGSGDLYRTATGWEDFLQVVETDNFPSSCGITFAPNYKVTASDGMIRVNNLSNNTVNVAIYDVNGSLVRQKQIKESGDFMAPDGIYLVKVGEKTYKTVVR